MFEYCKLRGKIREKFSTQAAFANFIEISTTTISDKLNNKVQWTQKEIDIAIKALDIPKEKIFIYFFTPAVQYTEHNAQN